MRANALTIKKQKAFEKHITRANFRHLIDNKWNHTEPTDSILSIIQEEKCSQKVLHPRLCSSKSLYSTPSAARQSQWLLCAQEWRTALIFKSALISTVNVQVK